MAAGVTAAPYTREILRLAAAIPHQHGFGDIDGGAEKRSRQCGARAKVAVSLEDGRVASLAQAVEACAYGQASAALMGGHAIGRSRDEIDTARKALGAWLAGQGGAPDWPEIGTLAPALDRPGRHAAILLPFDALLAAIEGAGG